MAHLFVSVTHGRCSWNTSSWHVRMAHGLTWHMPSCRSLMAGAHGTHPHGMFSWQALVAHMPPWPALAAGTAQVCRPSTNQGRCTRCSLDCMHSRPLPKAPCRSMHAPAAHLPAAHLHWRAIEGVTDAKQDTPPAPLLPGGALLHWFVIMTCAQRCAFFLWPPPKASRRMSVAAWRPPLAVPQAFTACGHTQPLQSYPHL